MVDQFKKNISVLPAEGIELKKITVDITAARDMARVISKNYPFYGKWLPFMNPNMKWFSVYKYLVKTKWMKKEKNKVDYGIYKNSEFIGAVAIFDISKEDMRCEIGYWLDVDYQKKGIVTAVINALKVYILDTLEFNRIQIICDVENHPSKKVAEKSGFDFEGVLKGYKYYPYFKQSRDHYIYSAVKKSVSKALNTIIYASACPYWLLGEI